MDMSERERFSSENRSTVDSCVGLDKTTIETDREIGLIVYSWKFNRKERFSRSLYDC
jgi:hypothetical protein